MSIILLYWVIIFLPLHNFNFNSTILYPIQQYTYRYRILIIIAQKSNIYRFIIDMFIYNSINYIEMVLAT